VPIVSVSLLLTGIGRFLLRRRVWATTWCCPCCNIQVLGGGARRGGGDQIRLPFLLGGEPRGHVPDRQRRRPAQRRGVKVCYFICGLPGHCAAGMKLEVRVRPAGCNQTTSNKQWGRFLIRLPDMNSCSIH
jgi:hypothetical protein